MSIICWRCRKILMLTGLPPAQDDGTLPTGTEVVASVSCHKCQVTYEVIVRKM